MFITSELLSGRRSIDELDNCHLVHDWEWDCNLEVWYFKFSIDNKHENNFLKITHWYLTAENKYPYGNVCVYPSVERGINNTYFHQSNNGLISENGLWRSGKLCLDTQDVSERAMKEEPSDSYLRILWYLSRTISWINQASKNELLINGQWLELPDFKITNTLKVIFYEDLVSEMIWNDCLYDYGYAELYEVRGNLLLIKTFKSIDGHLSNAYKWGSEIEDKISKQEPIKALWIKIKKPLVINGWQAPNDWGELKKSLKLQGINIIEIIKKLSPSIRDRKRHLLLIGFPFQEKVGGNKYIYQWKSILLSSISFGHKYANGFRKNELGWFQKDIKTIYKNNNIIEWTQDENWSAYSSLLRGRYDISVRNKKYLVIGAGTLSAHLCEQLIRNGIEDMTIMDDDIYKIGNNSRHTLNFEDVDSVKSKSLSERLNKINPHARINYINSKLNSDNIDIIKEYDVIIDCSGSNMLIFDIYKSKDKYKGILFSVSFGFKADNLYLYCCNINKLSYQHYINVFEDKINEDLNSINMLDLPQDGIGCWSPAFPALTSDVMLAAATSSSIITDYIKKNDTTTKEFIYSKKYNKDGYLIGYEEYDDI